MSEKVLNSLDDEMLYVEKKVNHFTDHLCEIVKFPVKSLGKVLQLNCFMKKT